MTLAPAHAAALRRGLAAALVVVATLAAHAAGDGDAHLGPWSPVAWAALVLPAAVAGPRAARLVPRGPVAWAAVLAAGQVVAHLAMAGAPWAFGLPVHDDVLTVTPAAAAAHLVAVIVATAVMCGADRLLACACRTVRALARTLGHRPARPGPPRRPAAPARRDAAGRDPRARHGVRAPPLVA